MLTLSLYVIYQVNGISISIRQIPSKIVDTLEPIVNWQSEENVSQ